ncbi:MAG: O-antigen ligase family protein, partial [Sciscionella sp.]
MTASVAQTTAPQQEPPRQPDRGLLPQVVVVGGVVAVAAGWFVVGVTTGRLLLATGIALGAVGVLVLLPRPRWLLAVLVVSEIANLAGIAQAHGIPRFSAALLALSVLGLLLRWARHGGGPVWSPVLWFGAAFFAARAVSVFAAQDRAESMSALTGLAADLLFFLVVFTLCVRLRGELLLARTMVITAAALSLLALVQQFLLGNATSFFGLSTQPTVVDVGLSVGRHSGPLSDPNFWGRVLVTIAPLALSLFADTSSGRRRWWWLGAFAVICGGVYLTGSRGTLLVLAAVLVLWCLLAGRQYRRLLLFTPLAVALLLVLPGVGTRLASITDVSNTSAETADLSLTGRIGVQELGAHMFAEHPAIGVGVANFQTVEPDYQQRYG